jgi:hypothetical protein
VTGADINTTERALLAVLLGGEVRTRGVIFSMLRSYRFSRVEHQVLFDCLKTLPLDRPELARELLPAALVRAGFPDVDLASFFEAGTVSEEEARTMCRELVACDQSSGNERNG